MATKNDLLIEQGTTHTSNIYLVDDANNPLNLTGYTATSQMKRTYTSLTSVSFTTTINASAGVVTLGLSAAATSNVMGGRYVYDVTLKDQSNNVTRVAEGIVVVTPGVTNQTIETTSNTYNSNTDFVAIPLQG